MDIALGTKVIAIRHSQSTSNLILSNRFKYYISVYKRRISEEDLPVIHSHIKRTK